MKTKLFFILISIFTSNYLLIGQPCTGTTFQKIYRGALNERAHSVQQTNDGGYIIAGETTSYGAGGKDWFLMKTDANSNMQWANTYGSSADEDGLSITVKQTSDLGYIVVGETTSFGAGGRDAYVIRTDANGNIQWENRITGSDNDYFRDVIESQDGFFYITGTTNTYGTGGVNNSDFYLVKLSSSGNLVWTNTYDGQNNSVDHATSIVELSNGDLIFTGTSDDGVRDGFISRVNALTGNSVSWSNTYGGGNQDGLMSSIQLTDGSILSVGYSESFGFGQKDIYVVKTDISGNVIWSKVYGGSGEERGVNAVEQANGNVIISGVSNSFNSLGNNDNILFSIDPINSGAINWAKIYGDVSADDIDLWGNAIALSSDGGQIMVGSTNNFGAIGEDIFFVKTNSCGESGCNETEVILQESVPTTIVNTIMLTNLNGGLLTITNSNVNTVNFTNEDLCPTCIAATDQEYIHITDPNTIYSTDVVWNGKYYIADNIIVTVDNGAALDITNVDVVFGECAGITFKDGAYLRANNSVFRPCNVDGTWRGIFFDGTQGQSTFDNIINQSTFKNAEIALYFQNGSDGVITDNLYSNCNNGVRVENNNQFNHSITGNRFVIEEFLPEFINCTGLIDNNSAYGIISNSSRFLQQVSQNEFVNSKGQSLPRVTGVSQKSGGGIYTSNMFTDLMYSIVINDAQFSSSIVGNEIEVNVPNISSLPLDNVSIFIDGTNGPIIEVNNNEVINNEIQFLALAAIGSRNSSNLSISGNIIEGFQYGIAVLRGDNIQITENNITNCSITGINYNSLFDGKGYITCNSIKMKNYNNTRGLFVRRMSNAGEISSNCITDCSVSMDFRGSFGLSLPLIRNNYLYNYNNVGINVLNYTGNIGQIGDPGMNTLWSNDNSAVDIHSNNNITVADNYGMFNISFPLVMITSNNPYHSTASCGHQIFNMPSQGNLNTNYDCENIGNIQGILSGKMGNYMLPNDYLQQLKKSAKPFEDANLILSTYNGTTQSILNDILNNIDLTSNEKALLSYTYFMTVSDYSNAKANLNSFVPLSQEEIDYKHTRLHNINIIQNGWTSLAPLDIIEIEGVANRENSNSNYAISLLNNMSSHRDYIFDIEEISAVDISTNIKNIEKVESYLNTYPSPASTKIYIELINNEFNGTIQLFDVMGKLIDDYSINIISGKVEVDVNNLPSGLYFITMSTEENGFIQKGKFIKD